MLRNLSIFLLLLVLPIATHAQLLPPTPPVDSARATVAQIKALGVLGEMASLSYERKSWDNLVIVLERMVELRPHSADLKFRLAEAYSLADKKSEAYELLLNMQRLGLVYVPDGESFANIKPFPLHKYIVDNMRANTVKFGSADLVFEIQQDGLVAETLAHDPTADRFFAGDLRSGKIYAVDRQGKAKLFAEPNAENGLRAVVGLAVDAKRKRLWVASSVIPHFVDFDINEDGRSALIAFDLDSGKLLERHAMPEQAGPSTLGTLTVAPNGTVYAADFRFPRVVQLPSGGKTIEQVLHSPELTEVRGLAVSDDGAQLYFSDYQLGLYVLDVASKRVAQIGDPEKLIAEGVDGLFFWKRHLALVQSGTKPKRVMRVGLEPGGLVAGAVQPLAANQEDFTQPGPGVVVGDKLYYIANSQFDRFDAAGRPKAGESVTRIKVYATDLAFNAPQQPTLMEVRPATEAELREDQQ